MLLWIVTHFISCKIYNDMNCNDNLMIATWPLKQWSKIDLERYYFLEKISISTCKMRLCYVICKLQIYIDINDKADIVLPE